MSNEPAVRTVRELGGEIWSEIQARFNETEIAWRVQDRLAEIVIGVLARHAGKLIENDEGIPVAPLPPVAEGERSSTSGNGGCEA